MNTCFVQAGGSGFLPSAQQEPCEIYAGTRDPSQQPVPAAYDEAGHPIIAHAYRSRDRAEQVSKEGQRRQTHEPISGSDQE
jgi:hypothetical protein